MLEQWLQDPLETSDFLGTRARPAQPFLLCPGTTQQESPQEQPASRGRSAAVRFPH